jgi:hypothetical protein
LQSGSFDWSQYWNFDFQEKRRKQTQHEALDRWALSVELVRREQLVLNVMLTIHGRKSI